MNVILLSLDTLRADHLSCYGYRRLTSPHLDRVAAQGTLCTEFFSPHIPTHPGYTTMLTGRDAVSHQVVCQGGTVEPPADVRFLAEILAEQGYRTAAVDNLGRWLTRGFQTYRSYRWPLDVSQPWRKAEVVNAEALPLLAELAAGGQPFFLFVHYWDPHTPYLPPPPFDRMFYGGDERDPANRSMAPVFAFEPFADYFRSWMGQVTDIAYPIAQYDAEIAYLDATLAAFFTRLDELDLVDDTLLIINADHGECLDEHECWFDHHGLYDQNLHVPLILRCPGLVPAGQRLGGFIRQYDLAPAILDALGLGELAATNQMDGASFLPQLRGGSPAGTCDALFLTENSWMKKRGVRTHRWKLILAHEPDFHGKPPVELYDLAADPGETVNLAGERPEVVAELTRRYDDWLRGRMAASGQPDPQSYQGTTLHRIGAVKLAVPADERLYAEGGKATEHG
jgi:arylsulfatase A-like enzyme